MIFPIPGPVALKPGSATLPFFGILPAILDENGKEIYGSDSGFLAFKVCFCKFIYRINIINILI